MSSLESNQIEILGLLSSLKESSDIIQKQLNTLKNLDGEARNNISPRIHDGAANKPENMDYKPHDRAAGIAESSNYKFHDGAAEISASNSPVKEEPPRRELHSNKISPTKSVNACFIPARRSNSNIKKERRAGSSEATQGKVKNFIGGKEREPRKSSTSTWVAPMPSTREMHGESAQWTSSIRNGLFNVLAGFLILILIAASQKIDNWSMQQDPFQV